MVGLLLYLRSKGEIATSNMAEINQYDAVKKAAVKLRNAGLITSEITGVRSTKVVWRLTPDGMAAAESLHDAERILSRALKLENNYKERVIRGI